MITMPITTPRFHSRVLTAISNFFSQSSDTEDVTASKNASPITIEPLKPDDTRLTPDECMSSIIGVTSPWIDCSSSDPVIADISRQVLGIELAYAAFCGLTYVVVHAPRGGSQSNVTEYARAILDGLSLGPYMQLYLWFQMTADSTQLHEQVGDLAGFSRRGATVSQQANNNTGLFDTWEQWDTIRSICRYSTRLGVMLSIPNKLPATALQTRWYTEPVRLLSLSADVFAKNARGYPSLTPAHQDLILRFMRLKTVPWLLLGGVGKLDLASDPSKPLSGAFPTVSESANSPANSDAHVMYMRNLQTKPRFLTDIDRFAQGYQDYLQAPLQPLTVNLESVTYEVFEKDPIKYLWYEKAIARALHDWIEQGKPTSNPDGRVVVAVVGAGRGPLVTRALKAAEDVGVDIDMWALEKNQNAFVLLNRHNAADGIWNQQVSLAHGDMRSWKGPKTNRDPREVTRTYNLDSAQDHVTDPPSRSSMLEASLASPDGEPRPATQYGIDIIVSELLGSFGDNELSPECLDGVQHLLNPVHGISIPASYTAHFTPIAAPKLHSDISLTMTGTVPHAAETPYVVMFDQIDFLSVDDPSTPVTSAPKAVDPTSPTISNGHAKPQSFASLFSADERKISPSSSSSKNPTESSTAAAKSNPRPQPIVHCAWSFQHPNSLLPTPVNSTLNAHNARHCMHTFPITYRATSHGLAGYFESVLYKGVELSTNPNTMAAKSEDMISWFPIYFPWKSPLILPERSELVVDMWRRTDGRRVWYEWIGEVFVLVAGRKLKVGATELHSSEKEACLM